MAVPPLRYTPLRLLFVVLQDQFSIQFSLDFMSVGSLAGSNEFNSNFEIEIRFHGIKSTWVRLQEKHTVKSTQDKTRAS